MIKILKHGDKRTIECKECGCIFSYEKEDVTTEQIGMNEHMSYVQCPDCSYVHENIKGFS